MKVLTHRKFRARVIYTSSVTILIKKNPTTSSLIQFIARQIVTLPLKNVEINQIKELHRLNSPRLLAIYWTYLR